MRVEERGGALFVTGFDGIQAYKIAVRIERDGIAFYEALAGKLRDPGARAAALALAGQEREHLAYFEAGLAALRAGREDGFEEDDLASFIDYGLFAPYRGLADAVETPGKALRLGLLVEDRSAQFYEACRAAADAADARRELGRIAAEERRHAETLRGMLAGARRGRAPEMEGR